MHVQMFTHRHLHMQGRLDTIVLRTTSGRLRPVGPAGPFGPDPSPIEWETMSYSWGGPGHPSAAQRRRAVAENLDAGRDDPGRLSSPPRELPAALGVWGRLIARRRPDRHRRDS